MHLSRRRLLVATGASLGLPQLACAAKAIGGQFVPEAFGAVGDGNTDDYDAFMRLIRAVNAAGGGSVTFARGRSYYLNRYITAQNGITRPTFERCSQLTIDGNGATIAVKGDFYRDQPSTRSLAGLVFEDCQNVTVRNLELNGNVNRTTRASSLPEAPSHGLIFGGCSDVSIDQITARQFAGDGLYIRESLQERPGGIHAASRRFTVRNSRFLFNARQGVSVIQLRGGIFDNCDFSYTGYIDAAQTLGPYGFHAPGAGVDVEPNQTPLTAKPVDVLTGDILFRNCRMVGNYGAAFLAGKFARGQRFLEQVNVDSCLLQCDQRLGGRYGFIFDVAGGQVTNCTLRMENRTAYIGWYRQSDANPRFAGNTVSAKDPRPGHPVLEVRATRGAPVIEDNRFVAESPTLGATALSWLVAIGNPNAILRRNQLLVSA